MSHEPSLPVPKRKQIQARSDRALQPWVGTSALELSQTFYQSAQDVPLLLRHVDMLDAALADVLNSRQILRSRVVHEFRRRFDGKVPVERVIELAEALGVEIIEDRQYENPNP